jgi:hypothetical protein
MDLRARRQRRGPAQAVARSNGSACLPFRVERRLRVTAEIEVGRAGGCGVGTWYHILGQVLLSGGMATGPSIQSISNVAFTLGDRFNAADS